jgi:hypothetical protein
MLEHQHQRCLGKVLRDPISGAQPPGVLQDAWRQQAEKPLARLGVALPGLQDQTLILRAGRIRRASKATGLAIRHPASLYHRSFMPGTPQMALCGNLAIWKTAWLQSPVF